MVHKRHELLLIGIDNMIIEQKVEILGEWNKDTSDQISNSYRKVT